MTLWPFFGVVTLVAAGVWSLKRRREDAWGGFSTTLRARPATGRRPAVEPMSYRLASRTVRGTAFVTYAVDIASRLDFEARREGRWHRALKWTGLVVEQQVGHDAFDAAVYVVSDDPRVLAALRDPAIVDAVSALFRTPVHRDFRVRRLVCRRGELRAEFDSQMPFTDLFGELAEKAVPALRRIADAMPPARGDDARDPVLWRLLLVLGLSSGLAWSGLFQLYRLMLFGVATTIDRAALFSTSLLVGAGLLGALVFVAVALLARTSRLPIVFAEVVLAGGFGAFVAGLAIVRDFNMALDRSESTPIVAEIVDKDTRRIRRGGRRYYLEFATVPPGLRSDEVRVWQHVHDSADLGECARIHRRDGRFGIAWYEWVEVIDCPAPATEPPASDATGDA